MRRTFLFALMIAAAPLAGCAGGEGGNEEALAELREQIECAGEIELVAELTADSGDRVERYTLSYRETGGEGEIEVLAPELIAGVRAKTGGERGSIIYDGVILDTGDFGVYGLTPIGVLPAMLNSLRTGHVESAWREDTDGDGTFVYDLTVSDEYTQSLWINRDSHNPLRSEIRLADRVIFTCVITGWSVS